jgi:hypothetical protein
MLLIMHPANRRRNCVLECAGGFDVIEAVTEHPVMHASQTPSRRCQLRFTAGPKRCGSRASTIADANWATLPAFNPTPATGTTIESTQEAEGLAVSGATMGSHVGTVSGLPQQAWRDFVSHNSLGCGPADVQLSSAVRGGPHDRVGGDFRLENWRHRLWLARQSTAVPVELWSVDRWQLHHRHVHGAAIVEQFRPQ